MSTRVRFLPPMTIALPPNEPSPEERAAEVAHEDLINATPTPFRARWRTDYYAWDPQREERVRLAAGTPCVVVARVFDDRLIVVTACVDTWLVAEDVRARRIDLA